MALGYIISAGITGLFLLVNTWFTAKTRRDLKTGNGMTVGQVSYELLKHVQDDSRHLD